MEHDTSLRQRNGLLPFHYIPAIKNPVAANGLISKLCAARVVEKEYYDLKFANDFLAYLAEFNQGDLRSKAATVGGWRSMMNGYDNSLKTLSDEEIGTTIVLLDFFMQKTVVR